MAESEKNTQNQTAAQEQAAAVAAATAAPGLSAEQIAAAALAAQKSAVQLVEDAKAAALKAHVERKPVTPVGALVRPMVDTEVMVDVVTMQEYKRGVWSEVLKPSFWLDAQIKAKKLELKD